MSMSMSMSRLPDIVILKYEKVSTTPIYPTILAITQLQVKFLAQKKSSIYKSTTLHLYL